MHQMCPILILDTLTTLRATEIMECVWGRNCISQGLPSENDIKDGREDSADDEDEEEDDDANPEIGLDQIRCDVWLHDYGLVGGTPTNSNDIQTWDKYLS